MVNQESCTHSKFSKRMAVGILTISAISITSIVGPASAVNSPTPTPSATYQYSGEPSPQQVAPSAFAANSTVQEPSPGTAEVVPNGDAATVVNESPSPSLSPSLSPSPSPSVSQSEEPSPSPSAPESALPSTESTVEPSTQEEVNSDKKKDEEAVEAAAAFKLQGAIGGRYNSDATMRATLGMPASNEMVSSYGVIQNFEKGRAYWSQSTGAKYLRNGTAIHGSYINAGGTGSQLGFPITDEFETGLPGSAAVKFYNEKTNKWNLIEWTSNGGTHRVYLNGAIGGDWENGSLKWLGSPIGGESYVGGAVDGYMQSFKGGDIGWSQSTGLKYVRGAIGEHYRANNALHGKLGKPVTNEVKSTNGYIFRQDFKNGNISRSIVWSPSRGATEVYNNGAIGSLWRNIGAENSWLGAPRINEQGLKRGGAWQNFDNGTIFWSPQNGAHIVGFGTIWDAWSDYGRENGQMGYPTSGSWRAGDGTIRQNFEGGTIIIKNGEPFMRTYGSVDRQIDMEASKIWGDTVARQYDNAPIRKPFSSYQVRDYPNGYIVWTEQYGAVAFSKETYNHWWRTFVDFGSSESGLDGLPMYAYNSGGTITTVTEQRRISWDPSVGKVRDNRTLGAGDALVIGDSQVWGGNSQYPDGSWVNVGITRAGYNPLYYRSGGIGYTAQRTGYQSSYTDGVYNNRWALPRGNPGIIFVGGSGNDMWRDWANVKDEQRRTIAELKRIYPKSKIVMSGVVGRSDYPDNMKNRWAMSDQIRDVAREQGVYYLDTRYWVSTSNAVSHLEDSVHIRPGSQGMISVGNTLRNALAQQGLAR